MAATGFSPQPNMSTVEFDRTAAVLRPGLEKLAARFNQRQLVAALVRALAIGLVLCAALMLLHRLYLADVSPTILAVILAACTLIGWRNGTVGKANVFRAALDADRALGLEERLSSAAAFAFPHEVRTSQRVEAHGFAAKLKAFIFPRMALRAALPASPTSLVPDLVEDAANRAQSLDPKRVYPFAFGNAEKIALASLVAFIAFALMPNLELFRTPEQRALAAILNRKGQELEQTAKRALQKPDDPKASETKKLAKKLEKLGQKMQRGRLGKREALVSMGELRKQLENAKSGEGQNGGGNLEQLEKNLAGQEMQSAAGRDFKQEIMRRDAEAAARSLEKLADKMERGELTEKEKQQAAKDLQKAADALRKAGGKANEDAAKNLEQAAKALQEKKENGEKGQGKQGGQQGSQNGQQGQKQGEKQGGEKSQNGKQEEKQGGQQGQKGQQNSQSKNGQGQQQGGQQSQQGSQSGQQGNQQGGQQGQQGSQGSPGQGQSGQQGGGSQSGADALRNAARGMREGSEGGSSDMSEMLDKIREAENDTGQNSGENSGQGSQGEGSGDCPGGNCQGTGNGTKLSPTDPRGTVSGGAGLGPRNNAQGAQSGGGVSKLKGAKSNDKRRWEDVWSDRLPPTQKQLSRINGKLGKSGEMQQLPTRTESQGGSVKTPYYDVYESYRKDMEDSVGKDAVPPAYKAPVKQYFDDIKPDKP